MSTHQDGEDTSVQTFADMKDTIQTRIDDIIHKEFDKKPYDSKQAQKWCNDTSE